MHVRTLPGLIYGIYWHLFKAKEMLGLRLATWHNLRFLLKLMEDVRQAIRDDSLGDFRNMFFEKYGYDN